MKKLLAVKGRVMFMVLLLSTLYVSSGSSRPEIVFMLQYFMFSPTMKVRVYVPLSPSLIFVLPLTGPSGCACIETL